MFNSGVWVDKMMMGSTISRYMLIIWDEHLSSSIIGVEVNTTLTLYCKGILEDDGNILKRFWDLGMVWEADIYSALRSSMGAQPWKNS